LKSHCVKGPPRVLGLFLTVIEVEPLFTSVGAFGIAGAEPVVIEVPGPVVLPNVLKRVAVTVYAVPALRPLIVPL
jgi:hypothetical protein